MCRINALIFGLGPFRGIKNDIVTDARILKSMYPFKVGRTTFGPNSRRFCVRLAKKWRRLGTWRPTKTFQIVSRGLQPSEFVGLSIQFRTDPRCNMARMVLA